MAQSNNDNNEKIRSEINFHGPVTGPIHTGSGNINITSNQKSSSNQGAIRGDQTTAVSPQELQQTLIKAFNISELQNLAFALNLDYEELPGQTKSDKARELIQYCQRHGKYGELVNDVKKLRPSH